MHEYTNSDIQVDALISYGVPNNCNVGVIQVLNAKTEEVTISF